MPIRASLFRYGAAIAINAIALVVTHLSWEQNTVHHASFVLLSSIVSTLYAGFKPALLSVALNVIVFHHLLASLPEGGAFTELLRRSMFAAVAILLAVLVSARRRLVRKDGSRFWASGIVSAVKSIGERRAADEARGYLLQRLDRAQQEEAEERLHISHELHDQIGQHLSGRLQSLRKLVKGMAEDLHRLMQQMRPSALDELGLEMALAGYAGEWSEMADVAVDFHSDGLAKHQLAPQTVFAKIPFQTGDEGGDEE